MAGGTLFGLDMNPIFRIPTQTTRAWLNPTNFNFTNDPSCDLKNPAAQPDCQEQMAPGSGDGCGELDWWFTEEALHPKPGPSPRPLRISEMPAVCAALVQPR